MLAGIQSAPVELSPSDRCSELASLVAQRFRGVRLDSGTKLPQLGRRGKAGTRRSAAHRETQHGESDVDVQGHAKGMAGGDGVVPAFPSGALRIGVPDGAGLSG